MPVGACRAPEALAPVATACGAWLSACGAEYATLATAGRQVRVVHVVLRHIVAVELE